MAAVKNSQSLGAIVIAIAVGTAIALAGSDNGDKVGRIPVFALCGFLAFAINWLAFIPSAIAKTEHYYDLTGGITYITVSVIAVSLTSTIDLRTALVFGMVIVWALRLSTFLFLRISKGGKDKRFDEIKTRPVVFLMAWTLQGLWVLLTGAAALAVITVGVRQPLGVIGFVGIIVWVIGFAIEVIADWQKSKFKADPANSGKFIDVGLWSWSRHPNYFGEIILWTGMAIVAFPVLRGWQYVTLISPLFVATLLTKVSGIPMLEQAADERWGGQADYEKYKDQTPVLIINPWAKTG